MVRKMLATTAGATALVVALAGCSGQGGASSSQESAIGQPGDTSISGDVTFWHAYSVDSDEVSTLRDVIIPKFTEMYPDVTVEDVAVPWDELHKKLVTGVAGEALPDLVRADLAWVPELANLGAIVPLSAEMPDYQQIADTTYPGMVETTRWDGEYYGLPLNTNTRVQLYNADSLAAAGIDEPPATVDELLAAAPLLKEQGFYAFADNGAGGWNILPWIWSGGGEITDRDVTVASGYMDSPETVAAVQTWVDMYQAGYVPDIVLGDSGGLSTSDGLADGTYATILDGPWMWSIFENQYPDFEVHAELVPAGDGGSVSVVGGEDIVLTTASDNKAAAAEFMRFLLSDWAQLEFAQVGQIPALKDLGGDLTSIHEYYGVFVDQLQTAKNRPATPAWSQIDAILQDAVRSAIRGEMSTEDAMREAAAESDELLAGFSN